MDRLARRLWGRSPTPAFVLVVLAVGGLLALLARGLTRGRRRARRRALLTIPEPPLEPASEPPAAGVTDQAAVDGLRERPRPVGAEEAARILGLAPEALAALNIPVTRGAEGRAVYDSWEIVHWLDLRRTDPAGFESRTGGR
ncbi:MAG: hypothetical protein ACREOF_05980 [Gemmatimonadales bacterium]